MILAFASDQWNDMFHTQWALVALCLVSLGVMARYLFLLPCLRTLKSLSKDISREILRRYSARSLIGWILITGALAVAEVVISFSVYWPSSLTRREGIFIALLLYLLGIILHVRSFFLATASMCKEKAELDRGL